VRHLPQAANQPLKILKRDPRVSCQFNADKFTTGLRANFGSPLAREVFLVPAGEMVVDYAANGHACRIKSSTKAMDDFLPKPLPLSMRGKEHGKLQEQMSGVTATFTKEKCQDHPTQ